MIQRLGTSKTFWIGLAGIATAVGAYFGGESDLKTTLEVVFAGLLAIGLRDGVAKTK